MSLHKNVMDKYKDKYRIETTRAQWWDYGVDAMYFITICTIEREHFFGEIVDGEMRLSSVGVIADVLWHEIPHHARYVRLGEFVVMPNHIHGILVIDKGEKASNEREEERRFQHQGKATISSVIGGYKSSVTKHANRLGYSFAWQPSFYDHIIRNSQSYQRISDYIANNPFCWADDCYCG